MAYLVERFDPTINGWLPQHLPECHLQQMPRGFYRLHARHRRLTRWFRVTATNGERHLTWLDERQTRLLRRSSTALSARRSRP